MNIVDNGPDYNVVFPNGTSVNPRLRGVKDRPTKGIGKRFRRTMQILEDLNRHLLAPTTTPMPMTQTRCSAKEGAKPGSDPEGTDNGSKCSARVLKAAVRGRWGPGEGEVTSGVGRKFETADNADFTDRDVDLNGSVRFIGRSLWSRSFSEICVIIDHPRCFMRNSARKAAGSTNSDCARTADKIAEMASRPVTEVESIPARERN